MQAVVTGIAGFIGSTLGEELLRQGHEVRGVDCFTPYYDPICKRQNLRELMTSSKFEFVEADLRVRDCAGLLAGSEVVFHQAAQPGVRLSWAEGFPLYNEHNVLATQRLLEGARTVGIGRFVYASSSSVYGNAPRYPSLETDLPRPHSPYGVTKLAGENLCGLYAANYGVPTVALRYFTVYGPRQRPDMAMHRLIEAGLDDQPFPLYGTGEQIRDFTFVSDVVRANISAVTEDVPPGSVFNVAGGGEVSMNELIEAVGDTLHRRVKVAHLMSQAGDVARTGGSIQQVLDGLGWKPDVDILTGISEQVQWQRALRET